MIGNASAFRINSDKGLSYYNNSSAEKSQFNVGPNGVVDAKQIGTVSNPIGNAHIEQLNTKQASISEGYVEDLNGTETPPANTDLQSVIDRLGNGGTIKLRSNTTYTLSSGLSITYDDFSIVGPRSAVLEFDSSGTDDSVITFGGSSSARNFTLRGFTIDGTNQTTPSQYGSERTVQGHGILGDDSNDIGIENSLIQGVRVINVKNEAVTYIGNSSDNLKLFSKVLNCVIENAKHRGIHPHNDHSVASIGNTLKDMGGPDFDAAIRHSNIILGNTFNNITQTNGVVRGGSPMSVIGYNVFKDCSGSAAIRAFRDEPDLISNNYIFDFDGSLGIWVVNDSATVVNNYLKNLSEKAIGVSESGSEIIDNTIINADLGNNGQKTIALAGVTDCIVRGNTIRNPDTTPAYGIREINSGDSNRIVDNYISGVSTPVETTGASTLVRRNDGRTATRTITGATPSLTWGNKTILIDASSNSVDATLPDPSAYVNEEIIIKAIDATNTVKYSQNGTETIDGSVEQTLSSRYNSHILESDGDNWHIIASK